MTCLKPHILVVFFLLAPFFGGAQHGADRIHTIEDQLTLLAGESPGLEAPVDLSVSGVTLPEFLRALGNANEVNISVDPSVKGVVVNNFNNVTVAEVLVFLAKQHNLGFEFTGSIIHISSYTELPSKINIPRSIKMVFDPISAELTMELEKDTLGDVVKALTQNTGKNVVFEPGLESKLLTIYLENVSFDQAMDKLAFANNLRVSKTQDEFYLIEQSEAKTANDPEGNLRFLDLNDQSRPKFLVDSNLISLKVENQPIDQVVRGLFQNLNLSYYLYSNLTGNVTLSIEAATLDELMQRLFAGTNYTFRVLNGTYVMGERMMEGLREVRRINLYNRSVETVAEYIPQELRKGLEVKEFHELNSLLVSGSYPQILELEKFVQSIDQAVPVVVIEVMIVDYQRNHIISNGIEAGLAEGPVATGGTVFPGLDFTMGSGTINELIESFDGFGALNLGPVTPNFYLSLKLLETNGILNVKSTPKLSTLNGHEATISIGNTEYYVVEQTNVAGVQNPIPITTRNYQSVEANFTLTIKPMVSADNQVTLNIDVEQSDFTARISPEAPPGSVSRQFTSMIRVRDQEMILLGGLEEKGYDDSGSGVPFLSRIPVLKWFFSSRTRNQNKSKLNIFIKPTIIY